MRFFGKTIFLIGLWLSAALYAKTSKDTLVIAYDSKIHNLDPRKLGGGDAGAFYLEGLRFARLINFDKDGNLIYSLLQGVEQTSSKEYVLTIKPNVHFHNGDEITIDDVLATYQSIIFPKEGDPISPRKAAFTNVAYLKRVSKHEMILALHEPDTQILTNLIIGILPKKVAESSKDLQDFKGLESGPYLLKSISETEIALERNDKFDLITEKSRLKEVIFKIIPNSGTRYAAFMRGDVDLIQNGIDQDKFELLSTQKNRFHTIKGKRIATTYLGFNFKHPELKHKYVREAFAHCINKEALVKYRLRDQAIIANSMFVEGSTYHFNGTKKYAYDIPKAKEILSKAKLIDKIKFELLVSDSTQSTIEVAKVIVEDLKKAGFVPTLKTLEHSTYLGQVGKGLADSWIGSWIGFKDPDILRFVFSSKKFPPNGGNRGLYHNASLDSILEKGVQEGNVEKRKKIYDEAQLIVSEDLPYVFLWHGVNTVVTQSNVVGYEPYADGSYTSLIFTQKLEKK
jgi:peptide/nickel transport system substrate-binding protein